MFTGHPKGLFRLFFIEMWERLAFYTMVGILLLYTIDTEYGGLGMSRVIGNEIYGLYLAFVYFTPYLGGLIADRFLGYRKSVLIGGIFFATGFVLMSIYGNVTFVSGIVCLCIGNGFFKPNISVMVGNLYEPGDPKRDAGFNIFYMGINIGALVANFLAAFARNSLGGWPAVFLCAAGGMVIGIVILLASWKVLEPADNPPPPSPDDTSFGKIFGVILLPAFVFGAIGYWLGSTYLPEGFALRPAVCGFMAGMIPIIIFFVRLGTTANAEEKPGLLALLPVYVAGGTFFMVLHLNGSAMTSWALDKTERASVAAYVTSQDALPSYYANADESLPRPSRQNFLVVDDPTTARMFGQQRMSEAALSTIAASLPADITIETIETPAEGEQLSAEQQAWAARTVDVFAEVSVEKGTDSHGAPTVSVSTPEGAKPTKTVSFVRGGTEASPLALYVVDRETMDKMYAGNVTELPVGEWVQVANPELFQSLNAFFVIALTPLIVGAFLWLTRKGVDFSTARKIFVGMALTTASLLLMALAGYVGGDGIEKVSWLWLVGFYAIVTIGELCLSPMALSLVTKLSPSRFVGLTMGGWFLATAFGNNFSGFFGGLESQMEPTSFFLLLAAISGAVALFILILLPKLDEAIKKYGA